VFKVTLWWHWFFSNWLYTIKEITCQNLLCLMFHMDRCTLSFLDEGVYPCHSSTCQNVSFWKALVGDKLSPWNILVAKIANIHPPTSPRRPWPTHRTRPSQAHTRQTHRCPGPCRVFSLVKWQGHPLPMPEAGALACTSSTNTTVGMGTGNSGRHDHLRVWTACCSSKPSGTNCTGAHGHLEAWTRCRRTLEGCHQR
jgi:hypothetical protein